VSNFQLINQGGPNNNLNSTSGSLSNYQAISWAAATPGTYSISSYNIYRNGSLYDTQAIQTVFQGYISGTTLTVTGVTSGTILPVVNYAATAILPGTAINLAQLSGTPGGVGTYQVNQSQTLGSASSPVTFSAWVYIDTNAPNSVFPDYSGAATVYTYNVAAVDSKGNVGPQASQFSAYLYQNGLSNAGDGNLNYGGLTANWADTTGDPQGGTYDIAATYPGGFQPVADAMLSPEWNIEVGAFNYYVIDINPGSDATWTESGLGITTYTRLPIGDNGHWQGSGVNVFSYGPAPVANTWATYKIPLSVLGFGTCAFTGSISGTTLTVTAVQSGSVCVDSDGFIYGAGVPSGTYVTGYSQSSSIGTFTIAGPGISGSTNVPSQTMTWQRTSFYKSGLQDNVSGAVTTYFNNIGFTAN
jgi:hypothetical protein